jgi:hypothetical protein
LSGSCKQNCGTFETHSVGRHKCGHFDKLQVGTELPETFPRGLKPSSFAGVCGTAEAVPFQNIGAIGVFPQAVKS